MHITKLELNNIKSYEEAFFEFERGTTAIVGENGSGKTTLIESIAWVVFDMLDYKKDDFLRRGAKTGRVSVEFESGLDERRYIVERDTRTSYYVYDPRSKTRIAEKKDEVTRFVWQHLGVEPGTDLESLFRRAIGVPQGTFTSIFLEPPSERKKAFEKLLKVEEYRLGASRLGKTSRHIEMLTNESNQKIARSEGVLTKKDVLKSEEAELTKKSAEDEKELVAVRNSVERLEKAVEAMKAKRSTFEASKSELDSLNTKESGHSKLIERLKNELKESEVAAKEIEKSSGGYEKYKSATDKLKVVEEQRTAHKESEAKKNALEKESVKLTTEIDGLRKQQQEFNEKSKRLESLETLVRRQTDLEKKRLVLERDLSSIANDKKRSESIEADLIKMRERFLSNDKQIKDLARLKPLADELPSLRKEEQEVTKRSEKMRARLEGDREFRDQISDGMCPIFREACKNLKDGQTLDGFLSEKFESIEKDLRDLERRSADLKKKLEEASRAKDSSAGLTTLEKRKEEIVEDGKKLRKEKERVQSNVEKEAKLKRDLESVRKDLDSLNDPIASQRILKKDLEKLSSVHSTIESKETRLASIGNELKVIDKNLSGSEELETERKRLLKERESNEESHRSYLKNQEAATRFEKVQKELSTTESELESFSKRRRETERSLETLSKEFDPEVFENESRELEQRKSVLVQKETEQKHHIARLNTVRTELTHLIETEKELKTELKEKDRLESLNESLKFIRNTLQQAAPQVAKNYVYHVSVEANRFFREISGDAESTLRWTDDYAIELEEQGYNRPFVSLSGGEQMSAALAVRLSLLRQLSDVRIAFFDEPTTNMDIERRERLAEQISRITESQTFDQMFVISHDDTFENYVDHVIEVGE